MKVIVILAPPPDVAYPFILDVEGYPQQIINFLIVIVRLLYTLAIIIDFDMMYYYRAYSGFDGANPTYTDLSRVSPR